MKIKHKGLHRIAILLGIVSIYILPDYLFFDYIIYGNIGLSPIFSDFWFITFENLLYDYFSFVIVFACIAAPLCFAIGYFSVKIIVWVYNGFIEDK